LIIASELKANAVAEELYGKTSSKVSLNLDVSDFGVEAEEGIDALTELRFDLLFAAFENVHGNASLATVLQLDDGFSDFGDFVGGEEAHSVNEHQVCHGMILKPNVFRQQTLRAEH
jgi:hypothetical protein